MYGVTFHLEFSTGRVQINAIIILLFSIFSYDNFLKRVKLLFEVCPVRTFVIISEFIFTFFLPSVLV